MDYTIDQLTKAYTAVHDGVAPDATTVATLQGFVNTSVSWPVSDAQVLSWILNSADNSTALVALSYQFFTGKSPSAAGFDYLLNSAANPTDLNDPAYANMALADRYINFAVNLGLASDGAAAFAAQYGAMDYATFVTSIYETIIGSANAKAAGIDPAVGIAFTVADYEGIKATAVVGGTITANMTAAEVDLAVKAATVGFLLAEAIKADVGTYPAAANTFMLALAMGDAVYETDLTATYPAATTGLGSSGKGQAVDNAPAGADLPGAPTPPEPPVVTPPSPPSPPSTGGRAYILTSGDDSLHGSTRNDTVTGTHLTFNAGDHIDGGAGDDTLTVTSTSGATYVVPRASVSNIETATITSDASLSGDTTGWTGLTKLNVTAELALNVAAAATTDIVVQANAQGAYNEVVDGGHDVTLTSTGATTGEVEIGRSAAPTGAVSVTRTTTGAVAAGDINVHGGASVSITQIATNAVNTTQTNGTVTITGSALTTGVTIKAAKAAVADSTHAGITANAVNITDVHYGASAMGTITTVDVDGYTTLQISDSALSTLKVAHGSGDIIIYNDDAVSAPVTALNLTLNGVTGRYLDDLSVYTTLNVTTGTEASTLADIGFNALTTLTLAGASNLTLTAAAGMIDLHTVTISGAAGLTATLTQSSLTAVDASATTGGNTLTLNFNYTSFTGGSGADMITMSGYFLGHAISLGGGDDTLNADSLAAVDPGVVADGGTGTDTLSLTVELARSLGADGASLFTNFEVLRLDTDTLVSADRIVDVDALGHYASVSVGGLAGMGAHTLTLSNFADDGTLTLTGDQASGVVALTNSGFAAGSGDTVNLVLSKAGAQNAGTLNIAGVETLHITTADTSATPTGGFLDTLTITDSALTTLTVDGNAGLTLTSAADLTNLQTVTISGAASLNATLTQTSITAIDASASTGGSALTLNPYYTSFTGGSGSDVITLFDPTSDVGLRRAISLGGGDDTLNVGVIASYRPGVVIDGGTGTDTLGLDLDQSSAGSSLTASIFVNFEVLRLDPNALSSTDYTVDVAVLGNYASVSVGSLVDIGAHTLTLSNFADDGTLTLTGDQASGVVALTNSGFAAGSSDTVNLVLSKAGLQSVGALDITDVETLHITTADTSATPTGAFLDTLTVTDSALTTLTVNGTAGLALTAASTALTSVDASGITLGGFTWAADALTDAITVKGSATGANTLDFTATANGVTYTGGTGADVVTVGGGANTIDVGADSSVDKVIIAGGTTTTDYTTITNLAHGDVIDLSGFGGLTTASYYALYLANTFGDWANAVAELATLSDGTTVRIGFIHYDGDSYIVEDRSASSTFVPGVDVVVKLVGVELYGSDYNNTTHMVTINS